MRGAPNAPPCPAGPDAVRAGLSLSATSLRTRLPPRPELRRIGGILLRVLAGVFGGYGVTALATMLLSVSLPMSRSEAVVVATMASFAVHAGAVVWAFAVRSAWRAAGGIAAAAAMLWLLLLLLER